MPRYNATNTEIRLASCELTSSLTLFPEITKSNKIAPKVKDAEEAIRGAVTLLEEPVPCFGEDTGLHFLEELNENGLSYFTPVATPFFMVKVHKQQKESSLSKEMSALNLSSRLELRSRSISNDDSELTSLPSTPLLSPGFQQVLPLKQVASSSDHLEPAQSIEHHTTVKHNNQTQPPRIVAQSDALVLAISLSAQALRRMRNPARARDLKIDVFLNGTHTANTFINNRFVRSSPKPETEVRFAGERIDTCLERAWLLKRHETDAIDAEMQGIVPQSSSVIERWEAIARLLRSDSDAIGFDTKGSRSPVGKYLSSLAILEPPDQLLQHQTPGSPTFAVLDVVLSLGEGRKLTASSSYVKKCERLTDGRFKPRESTHTHLTGLEQKGTEAHRSSLRATGNDPDTQMSYSFNIRRSNQQGNQAISEITQAVSGAANRPRSHLPDPILTSARSTVASLSTGASTARTLRSRTDTPAPTRHSSIDSIDPISLDATNKPSSSPFGGRPDQHLTNTPLGAMSHGTAFSYTHHSLPSFVPIQPSTSSPQLMTGPPCHGHNEHVDRTTKTDKQDTPLLGFANARSKRNSLATEVSPSSAMLPPKPTVKKQKLRHSTPMPATSSPPPLAMNPPTEVSPMRAARLARQAANAADTMRDLPFLTPHTKEKQTVIKSVSFNHKDGSPIFKKTFSSPVHLQKSKDVVSPLMKLARSPTSDKSHDLSQVGPARVLFPSDQPFTGLTLPTLGSTIFTSSKDSTMPEQRAALRLKPPAPRGGRRGRRPKAKETKEGSDDDPTYVEPPHIKDTASESVKKRKRSSSKPPTVLPSVFSQDTSMLENQENTSSKVQDKSPPTVTVSQRKQGFRDASPVPALSKDCVVSYLPHGMKNNDGMSFGVRQIRAERPGEFHESEVLMGVRFIICEDWFRTEPLRK